MKINKDEIAQILTSRGATKPCHRCGRTSFMVLDGFSNFNLQDDHSTAALVIGGPTVPVVHVACTNCGAISSHAIGALGLLDNPHEASKK